MPRSFVTSKSPSSKPKNTVKQKKWAFEISQFLSRKNRPKAKSVEQRKSNSKSKTRKYKSLPVNWKPILKEYIPRFRHILSEDEIQEMLEKRETYYPEIADKILQEIEAESFNERSKINELSKVNEIKIEKRTKEYMGKSKRELIYDLKMWDCLLKNYGFENIPASLKNIFEDKDNLFKKELRIKEEIENIKSKDPALKDCIDKN
jgi:hypothetical protein